MLFQLSPTPLDPFKLSQNFTAPGAGAFTCFEGRVRDNNEGKSVVALDYEAYEPLCRAEMEKIFQEARNRFAAIDIRAAHRTGKLKVGELAVWVGVLAAHRDEAFTACRYVIDELKKRLPIWKKEYYADDTSNGPVAPNTPVPTDDEKLPLAIDIDSLTDEQIRQYTFVDVREDGERMIKPCRELAHEHFPLSRFQPADGFPADPQKHYIFFCAKGQRSLMLAEHLREQGIRNVSSLDGGIDAIKEHFRNS